MKNMRDPSRHHCRHGFLRVGGVIAVLICLASPCAADDAGIRVETITYRKVGDLEIKADLHRADDEVIRPVVVWIHGGALINGHREGISRRVRTMVLDDQKHRRGVSVCPGIRETSYEREVNVTHSAQGDEP